MIIISVDSRDKITHSSHTHTHIHTHAGNKNELIRRWLIGRVNVRGIYAAYDQRERLKLRATATEWDGGWKGGERIAERKRAERPG